MTDEMRTELLGAVATWARSKGVPRPRTKEGVAKLLAEFMADQPAWYEVTGDPTLHLGWNGVQTQILDAMHGTPDDFDELVENRTKAMIEGHGDDLSRDALMITGDRAALVQEAPFQRINPPSVLNTPIGGQVVVNSDGKTKEVARWAGNDAETSAVTVTFGPVGTAASIPFVGPLPVRPFGVCRFGTRGFLSELVFDVGRGVQFTVTGSTVILEAGVEFIDPVSVGQTTLTLTGMLSFHPTEKDMTITRSSYVDNLAFGGASVLIDTPNFADNLICFRSDQTSPFTLEFIDQRFVTRYSVSTAASANMTVPVPLSGDIYHIRLTNNAVGPGGTAMFRLIFGLVV